MTEELPADRLYREGLPFGDFLFDEIVTSQRTLDEIDWDVDTSVPDPVRQALNTGATQFHYNDLSNLIMCGSIIKLEAEHVDIESQKLAILLSSYKIQGMDAWGRYLAQVDGGTQVSPVLKRYFRALFSEDHVLGMFLGMEVLGAVMEIPLFEHLSDVGDPLWQQLMDAGITQKRNEIDLVEAYLAEPIEALEPGTKQEISRIVNQYRSLGVELFLSRAETFAAVGKDTKSVTNDTHEAIDAFCERINIPVER